LESTEPRFTIADIPGIIEGAHQGTGLGIRFLKHISRARCLLILLSFEPHLSLQKAYRTLLHELESYDPYLLQKPRIVCVNKSDLMTSEDFQQQWEHFHTSVPSALLISAKHQKGTNQLIPHLRDEVLQTPR